MSGQLYVLALLILQKIPEYSLDGRPSEPMVPSGCSVKKISLFTARNTIVNRVPTPT